MSFSDSNGNSKRLGAFGKVFKDIQTYTKTQGKQVCSMVKSTDLIPSSLKQSQTLNGNKSFFSRGVSGSGQVKHKSLKEEDETILWDSDNEDERFPYHNNNNNNCPTKYMKNNQSNNHTSTTTSTRQTNHYTHNGNIGWIDSNGNFRTSKSEKSWTRGIRIPFMK